MPTQDPRHRLRERIALAVFTVLVVVAVFFHKDLGRRILAYKVAHGVGGMDRLFELAEKGPALLPYIEGYMDDPDPDVRMLAAMAVKAMHHPACLPVFHRMTRSEDTMIRVMGLDGLGETVQMAVFPILVQGLRDPEEKVRYRCARVLEELTGETFGYRPEQTSEEREEPTAKWETWLEEVESKRMGPGKETE